MSVSSSTFLLDSPVKATADDAMVAKLAATHAGYYTDPFIGAMTEHIKNRDNKKPQPIIKRGTHARVCVMDRAISTFLRTTQRKTQIVVLGAGKDTSYFRYRNGNIMGLDSKHDSDCIQRWYEVDHTSVITNKVSLIRKSNLLTSYCPHLIKTEVGFEYNSTNLVANDGLKCSSSSYHLVGHDLRDSPTKLMEKLALDPTLPTLFIMECVSMYISIKSSESLLRTLSVSADITFIACYEPILNCNNTNNNKSFSDPFGHVMERNFEKMGLTSPESCLLKNRTLQDQLKKLLNCDFVRAVGCDMSSAYETIVTDDQRKRANKSEFMDEYEEWILIMRHYCFVVARGGCQKQKYTSNNLDGTNTDLTTVLAKTDKDKSLSLGWVLGKCLELEKSGEQNDS